MTGFVLDNSVAMRWHLESGKASDQKYAEAVLLSLADADVLVPSLWHLEATNVLVGAEKRGDTTTIEVERFIAQLEGLPINVDPSTANHAFSRTLSLSRAYKLSSYDAAYLELAIREGLSLATLDKNLLKAAKKADVPIYLKDKS
ncbi:type II toxin-antitoxin system VapC family toxin [Oceanicoccus sp. KOV_DT_Chl]|uniref:type II toxin-antitoxin system VapC family toxin n=1 Tax=Oceanicoccus sp. KOV_DT_Chl TaxID=1904639 RepID=UPI000C7BB22A|nr:type II toxin-antitoxin system VapC family toxin [Oceanicoccus sp. KOV_DT_Chl]